MTRIGTDIKLIDGTTLWGDAFEALRSAKAQGLEGALIRTLDELSPTLDAAYLADFAALAKELDLYVEMGVGKVNPYMTAELPRVRDLGEGSYLAGMERMIETCAAFGWTETWSAVGGFKPYPGIFFTDRFRSDADWADQLAATAKLLHRLAPALRAHGVHLNLETHEEITTFEIVRIIEEVGPDVLGVCLDTGNLPVRGEVPVEAVARVAPYVRSSHLRDAALLMTEEGMSRFLAPCGQGVIDWDAVLELILTPNPSLNLTIEGIGSVRAEMVLHLDDPQWLSGHPDLRPEDLEELRRLADSYQKRADAGEVEGLEQLRAVRPQARESHDQFVATCASYLRERIAVRQARSAESAR